MGRRGRKARALFRNRTLTVREAVQATGLKKITIHARLKRLRPDESPDVALLPIGHRRWNNAPKPLAYRWNSETKTVKEWSVTLGITEGSFRRRLKKHGFKEQTFVRGSASGRPRYITFCGKTLHIAQWAKELCVTRERVRQRLKKYPVEEALDPLNKHRERRRSTERTSALIEWAGESLTRQQWAARLGISYSAMCKRIRQHGITAKSFFSRRIEWDGKGLTKKQWAERLGLTHAGFCVRIQKFGVTVPAFRPRYVHTKRAEVLQ